MRRLEKWMLIELSQPTIVAELYNDPERYPGFSVNLEVVDIDCQKNLLYSTNGVYELGKPDQIWWTTKKKRLLR